MPKIYEDSKDSSERHINENCSINISNLNNLNKIDDKNIEKLKNTTNNIKELKEFKVIENKKGNLNESYKENYQENNLDKYDIEREKKNNEILKSTKTFKIEIEKRFRKDLVRTQLFDYIYFNLCCCFTKNNKKKSIQFNGKKI